MWNKEITEKVYHRIGIFGWVALVLFVALFVRLWYLSVLQGEWYRERSEKNWVRIVPLQALRGSIYDRNGKVLAEDLPHFRLVLLEGSMDIGAAREKVGKILQRELLSKPREIVPGEMVLLEDLSLEDVVKIEEAQSDLPGVLVESYPHRFYPGGEIFSHVVGYVGKVTSEEFKSLGPLGYEVWDRVGKGGIELWYENVLRGEKGYRKIEVDALGRVRRILENHPARFENSLVLTLDKEFQEYCYELLGNRRGTIIVGEPSTGEILVLVSKPSFDPNALVEGLSAEEWSRLVQSEAKPFTNRALQAMYPPGSIFKLLVAIAGLEEQAISAQTTFFCPGFLEYNGKHYYCWNRGGHGTVNVEGAIAYSCNVFFYNLALRLGPEKIVSYAQKFGLGTKSSIDLPGTKEGFLPTPNWKKQTRRETWYPGDTLNLSIGQGYLLVTPFEIYRLLCGIANRGKIYKPHLLKGILDSRRRLVKDTEVTLEGEVRIRESTWNLLINGMKRVVTQGTGYACRDVPVELAAKTGTAQNPHGRDHSWFGGFFPVDRPEIVFLVFIENGGDGSGEAAHTARGLINWFLENRGIKSGER
ncbi:MAG: penicillin-binding protein 2 [Candidatus Caldatribacteriaceae bacterium]